MRKFRPSDIYAVKLEIGQRVYLSYAGFALFLGYIFLDSKFDSYGMAFVLEKEHHKYGKALLEFDVYDYDGNLLHTKNTLKCTYLFDNIIKDYLVVDYEKII